MKTILILRFAKSPVIRYRQRKISMTRSEPGGQNSRVESHVDHVDIDIVFKTIFKLEVDKRFGLFEQAAKLDFLES